MNPPAIELYLSNGIDLTREPLEIAVCAQHNNGGLAADIWWESTNIGRLFPVGEVNGTHGVYRPGGSALNFRAGRGAAGSAEEIFRGLRRRRRGQLGRFRRGRRTGFRKVRRGGPRETEKILKRIGEVLDRISGKRYRLRPVPARVPKEDVCPRGPHRGALILSGGIGNCPCSGGVFFRPQRSRAAGSSPMRFGTGIWFWLTQRTFRRYSLSGSRRGKPGFLSSVMDPHGEEVHPALEPQWR